MSRSSDEQPRSAPPAALARTPLERLNSWRAEIKRAHPSVLALGRAGQNYYFLDDDARAASRAIGLALTSVELHGETFDAVVLRGRTAALEAIGALLAARAGCRVAIFEPPNDQLGIVSIAAP